MVAGEDVGGHVHPGDVAEMRLAIDVGPGYADEDISRHFGGFRGGNGRNDGEERR